MTPTQDPKLDAQIRKLQSQIEKLRRELVERERNPDLLLAKAHNSEKARKVPYIANMDSAVGIMIGGSNDGFRTGDHLVFVRHTKEGLVITGQGLIVRAWPTDSEFGYLSLKFLFQPEDEVYISNRGDSIYSLALLRF